jgi:phosphoribosylformimino-5-aminoimidazole carboxamide ribotide isomerase
MTKFRPCIDLHNGQVKQIVGATLHDNTAETNFTSTQPPSFYAELYKQHHLTGIHHCIIFTGSHCIKLGPNNDDAALEILQTWPDQIQLGSISILIHRYYKLL